MLIRAWRESGAVRGRLLYEAEDGVQVSDIAGSVEELCGLACAALEVWATTS